VYNSPIEQRATGSVAGSATHSARSSKGNSILGTTIPPFANSFLDLDRGKPPITFYTSEKEAVRQKVNAWILNSGEFDGVADLDAVLRDPSHPTRLLPSYDSGDHLHPNNAGCRAEGNAIPLALFEGRQTDEEGRTLSTVIDSEIIPQLTTGPRNRMRKSCHLLLLGLAFSTGAVAQQFEFPEAVVGDPRTLAKAIPPLARQFERAS